VTSLIAPPENPRLARNPLYGHVRNAHLDAGDVPLAAFPAGRVTMARVGARRHSEASRGHSLLHPRQASAEL